MSLARHVRRRGPGVGGQIDRAAAKAADLLLMHARAIREEVRQELAGRWTALQLAIVEAELCERPARHPRREALERDRQQLLDSERRFLWHADAARDARIGALEELGRVLRGEDGLEVDAAEPDDDD